MREHRDEVVLDLVQLDDRIAARSQLFVEFDVAGSDREILAEQSQREHVGGAERQRPPHLEDVGGAPARARDTHRGAQFARLHNAEVAAGGEGQEPVVDGDGLLGPAQVAQGDETAAVRRVQLRVGAEELVNAGQQRFDEQARFERGEQLLRDRGDRRQAFVLHREFGAAQVLHRRRRAGPRRGARRSARLTRRRRRRAPRADGPSAGAGGGRGQPARRLVRRRCCGAGIPAQKRIAADPVTSGLSAKRASDVASATSSSPPPASVWRQKTKSTSTVPSNPQTAANHSRFPSVRPSTAIGAAQSFAARRVSAPNKSSSGPSRSA
jgi:hypothetical protein